MAMAQIRDVARPLGRNSGAGHPSRDHRRAARHMLALPVILLAAGVALAVGYIAYVLWPRWPSEPVALDAPAIPISVADTIFNVPPAAIRMPMQRRPGRQERIDLVFLWPSLEPPNPGEKLAPVLSSSAVDRVFVTVAGGENTLPPAERVKTIYPRYLETRLSAGPGGLAVRPFRDGTPYQGEELVSDTQEMDRFVVRCTRDGAGGALGMCLYEKRIGNADVTVRFPRDWLSDWRNVAKGVEQLIAGFRTLPPA